MLYLLPCFIAIVLLCHALCRTYSLVLIAIVFCTVVTVVFFMPVVDTVCLLLAVTVSLQTGRNRLR